VANVVVVGGQWGDEGKGKIVDLLTEHVEICARFSGGHNAGHTVKIGDVRYPLHLVPCGILRPRTACVIGNGVVIEPGALLGEIDQLAQQGIEVEGRLFVSDRAHLILAYHPQLDQLREAALADKKIGTTSRGIGPAYEDKHARTGLRVGDLWARDASARLGAMVLQRNETLRRVWDARPIDADAVVAAFLGPGGYRDRLEPWVVNTMEYLNRRLDEGAAVLMEGAQGALLDVDHGTYPYVTSSTSTAGGACTGLGLSPLRIDDVFGIFKAYCTRVGTGPFPTELADATGETIRARGNEYGTTTGRPRRCGWFDAVAARHSVRVNGLRSIALTLLDVLDEFDELLVCTAYRHGGRTLTDFPSELGVLEECEPVYRTVPGWRQPLSDLPSREAFPQRARDYLALLQDLLGVEIAIVSVGPERRRSIVDEGSRFWRLLTGGRD
jgi:adenylosuccinate synthase